MISLGAAAPFLWALMAKKPDSAAYKELWLDRKYNHGPLLVLEIARNIFGVLLIGFWVDKLFSAKAAILIALPIIITVMIIFSTRIQQFYQRIEGRFLRNLNERDITTEEELRIQDTERKKFKPQNDLSPWDAHMIDLEINPHAQYIGKTLTELAWRENFGINIAYIKRGDKLIYAPGRNNRLLPFDNVGLIATDEQMQHFKSEFDSLENIDADKNDLEDIILQKIVVDEHNKLKGLSIRSSHVRERTNGLIVGIERNNKERILNPDSSTIFEWGDIVWIVGERNKIQKLNN